MKACPFHTCKSSMAFHCTKNKPEFVVCHSQDPPPSLPSLLHSLSRAPLASFLLLKLAQLFLLRCFNLWFLLLRMPFLSPHSQPPPLLFAWPAPSQALGVWGPYLSRGQGRPHCPEPCAEINPKSPVVHLSGVLFPVLTPPRTPTPCITLECSFLKHCPVHCKGCEAWQST